MKQKNGHGEQRVCLLASAGSLPQRCRARCCRQKKSSSSRATKRAWSQEKGRCTTPVVVTTPVAGSVYSDGTYTTELARELFEILSTFSTVMSVTAAWPVTTARRMVSRRTGSAQRSTIRGFQTSTRGADCGWMGSGWWGVERVRVSGCFRPAREEKQSAGPQENRPLLASASRLEAHAIRRGLPLHHGLPRARMAVQPPFGVNERDAQAPDVLQICRLVARGQIAVGGAGDGLGVGAGPSLPGLRGGPRWSQ